VNPEAPWPDITRLGELTADAGYALRERLTVYPEYLADDDWVDAGLRAHVRALADDDGLALPGGPAPMAVAAAGVTA
jgi:FO synthase